jgi:hypothetical protein
MAVLFSVARLDGSLSAGWAVVRHETGEADKYASRIFLREQDAVEHAHRLTMQEATRARKAAGLSRTVSIVS